MFLSFLNSSQLLQQLLLFHPSNYCNESAEDAKRECWNAMRNKFEVLTALPPPDSKEDILITWSFANTQIIKQSLVLKLFMILKIFQLPAVTKCSFVERREKKRKEKKMFFSPNSYIIHHNFINIFMSTIPNPLSLHFNFLPLKDLTSMLAVRL